MPTIPFATISINNVSRMINSATSVAVVVSFCRKGTPLPEVSNSFYLFPPPLMGYHFLEVLPFPVPSSYDLSPNAPSFSSETHLSPWLPEEGVE
ncbi:hypothetical protein CDAR_525991 [Caerostris darwini]|uniref:Uncharacterized protein n=1 Tax=Caerostris darwini TaxID=1538125 RepID=A0AAV4Q7E4_9ARAC|nr:hypothetical protein CDAR_525991 [Caerostris darwini]